MAIVMLLVAMLIIAVVRVHTPFGQQAEGKPIGRITLSMRERALLQRTNMYLIGAVILISTIAGFLGGPLEVVAIVAASAILAIPVRYTLTSQGIAMNNVVFRSWTEFTGYRVERTGVVLLGGPGRRNFRLHVMGSNRATALKAVARLLPVTGEPEPAGARATSTTAKAR